MESQKKFLENFKNRALRIQSSDNAKEKILSDISKLTQMAPNQADHAILAQHIQFALSIPWDKFAAESSSLKSIQSKFTKNVYGLDSLKSELMDHISVLKLTGNFSHNICFTGPPGVGKTLLAKNLAAALGRPCIRIPVSSISQESDLFGQSKIYMGAQPGKIIQSIIQAGIMNPVILFEGMDKIPASQRTQLAAAFSEILDKSAKIFDKYLELKYDTSKIIYILTANLESAIPYSIRQKVECYRIPGYYDFEKQKIAGKYLVPKVQKLCGLKPSQLKISDSGLKQIIARYTEEAGVNQLEKQLMHIGRKQAKNMLLKRTYPQSISEENITNMLGVETQPKKNSKIQSQPGVCKGLAWTNVGGQILDIECKILSGKGRIHLTGKMGDIMKESAIIALTLVKERAKTWNIDINRIRQSDIHLHIPEGAFPKDGPSAGLALVVSILSALLQKPISSHISFTGEISLTGQLIGVGGIREKFIAAYNAGIKKFYLPEENSPDCQTLSKDAIKKTRLLLTQSVDDVLNDVFK